MIRFCYAEDMGMRIALPLSPHAHYACRARLKDNDRRCCICYPCKCLEKRKETEKNGNKKETR